MKATLTAALVLAFLCISASSHAQITLKVGDAQGAPGKEAEVPILISGSKNVGPIQFILDYDHRMLEAIADPPDAEPRGVVFGKVISGGSLAQSVTEPGEVRIAMQTDEPITEDGELVRVRFLVKGKRGDSCTLNVLVPEAWEKKSLFEVQARAEPGTFKVAGLSLGLPLPLIIAIVAGVGLLAMVFVLMKKRSQPALAGAGAFAAPSPGATPASAPSPSAQAGNGGDPMSLLKKLKDMQEAGLISAEDFEKKKRDLLDRL